MSELGEYDLAFCIDCGKPTIGGRGHFIDCKPVVPLNALERLAMDLALEEEEEAD